MDNSYGSAAFIQTIKTGFTEETSAAIKFRSQSKNLVVYTDTNNIISLRLLKLMFYRPVIV